MMKDICSLFLNIFYSSVSGKKRKKKKERKRKCQMLPFSTLSKGSVIWESKISVSV